MAINISDNSPRVSYTVAQGQTQTSFAVTFIFFDDADLNVYVDGVLKTLASDYTVTGGDGATGTVTISVTGASGGSSVVVTRSIALERTSDFPTSGPFQVDALNTELDRLTGIVADLEDKADRGLQLTDYDLSSNLVLPDLDGRKGRTLAFNEVSGAVEAGPTISDVQTVANASADIQTLAHIEDGTDATDAIQTVASISSNVTTVAGISSNVTTVAGISADVTAVAGDEADIGTVATNIADVNTAADNITDIQNASTNAATATTKASEAATSATNAATSETNAATSATNAATSATTATTKASEASTSATNAATSETNAATSATAAAASQTAAAASAASAASAFDNFDDTYLGSKTSDPTVDNDGDPLTSGDLYFNSTANEMRVYDGANWIAASSAGGASLLNYNYTATSGQTTFSGADDNAATLSYTAQNLIVTLNGIVLEDGTDYTATNGTSVVLSSGAAAGDELNIVAFKSFTTADMVPASTGGTFSGNVTMTADLTVDTNTLYVDSTNNRVGVGTSSPSQQLHLSSSTPIIRLTDTDTNAYGEISSSSSDGNLMFYADQGNTQANTTMRFYVDAAERMRIKADGTVLINTTSFFQSTKVGIEAPNVDIFSVRGNNVGAGYRYDSTSSTGLAAYFSHSSNTVAAGSITIGSGSTSYNTSSDYRLKENVTNITDGVTRIKQLEPKRFNFIINPDRTVDGFFAHEAQTVVPEAVTGTHNEVDADGNPVYQGIDQSKLVPLLTAALKESIAKIETLETEMTSVKARLDALEGNT